MALEKVTLGKSLTSGLRKAMEKDPKVVLIGEDIGAFGNVDGPDGREGERGEQECGCGSAEKHAPILCEGKAGLGFQVEG